jgi:NADPH-dependent 7-cyano-7-deazaguanine reductase QueF-like protein
MGSHFVSASDYFQIPFSSAYSNLILAKSFKLSLISHYSISLIEIDQLAKFQEMEADLDYFLCF